MRAPSAARSASLACGAFLGVLVLVSGQTMDWKSPPERNFPIVGGNLFNQRALRWQYPKGDIGPGGGAVGGPDNHFNRGVVVAEGKVFSAAYGTTLLA
jgi:hypothetical protein